jgi:dihydroflavonol-4-reductase
MIPTWVLTTVGVFGSLLRMLGIPAELSLNNARILASNDYYTGQKAINDLNMQQTPVQEAVSEAIGWFKGKGML